MLNKSSIYFSVVIVFIKAINYACSEYPDGIPDELISSESGKGYIPSDIFTYEEGGERKYIPGDTDFDSNIERLNIDRESSEWNKKNDKTFEDCQDEGGVDTGVIGRNSRPSNRRGQRGRSARRNSDTESNTKVIESAERVRATDENGGRNRVNSTSTRRGSSNGRTNRRNNGSSPNESDGRRAGRNNNIRNRRFRNDGNTPENTGTENEEITP